MTSQAMEIIYFPWPYELLMGKMNEAGAPNAEFFQASVQVMVFSRLSSFITFTLRVHP